ncbi:PREDICTED: uncharacterized protein LOC109180966 isoform X2 [Ipomoea nil]|uniref:uncharacterized protein LOC109180966 isoform X2 n=1 Tax=Ipomoea nil TaxID=35883 RepID=UPI0009011335|nr:PREDICTED: uncharacterized protein LOC109180966 isoform X2 [Ipomoea nil]
MATMLVPPWLEPLLNTAFFAVCRTHGDGARSECNMFCLDCGGAAAAFCFYCRSSRHKDHQVIQIRRSSYHDVVRVSEIQRVLDITGVQTYVINSARVLFLNERPQPKTSGKAVSHICEICSRSLLDPFQFCSLGCKLVGIKRNGNASFVLDAKNEFGMERGEGISSRRASKEEDELREASQHDIYPATPPPPPSNGRRRKGIPRRAPFLS